MKLRQAVLIAAFALTVVYPLVTLASGLSGGFSGQKAKSLSFYNTHTQETLDVTFWRNGAYVPAALEDINVMLRDHRNGHVHQMSFDLLNLLSDLKTELQRRNPGQPVVFHIISAYRSPATNNMLRASGGGQAKNSRHMHGDAIDIRVPGIDTAQIRDVAWCLQRGGVGYYQSDDFVHVDTDKVRHWKWKPRAGMCSRTNS